VDSKIDMSLSVRHHRVKFDELSRMFCFAVCPRNLACAAAKTGSGKICEVPLSWGIHTCVGDVLNTIEFSGIDALAEGQQTYGERK